MIARCDVLPDAVPALTAMKAVLQACLDHTIAGGAKGTIAFFAADAVADSSDLQVAKRRNAARGRCGFTPTGTPTAVNRPLR